MMRMRGNRGVSLVELVVTLTILTILSALIIPSVQMVGKRQRELELRRTLRTVRTAIDQYYAEYKQAEKDKKIVSVLNKSGYPKELKTLVDGDDFGIVGGMKKKFLRRIPIDPLNPPKPGEEPKWGIRGYKDEPDGKHSGTDAEDVYDIYSLSEATAIDGTKYKDW